MALVNYLFIRKIEIFEIGLSLRNHLQTYQIEQNAMKTRNDLTKEEITLSNYKNPKKYVKILWPTEK